MGKKLSPDELIELEDWLKQYSINKIINKNKFHRSLSDGVLVAMLLKEMYPKLIDLHNYSSSSSFQLKRVNWETLNNKVFKKLGIQQSSSLLDGISKSNPGNVEQLLMTIKRNEEYLQKKRAELQSADNDSPYAIDDEIVMMNINKKIGDAIIQVPQKMILYSIYEEAVQDSKKKDIKMDLLCQKIIHLENIIELKNEHIDELTSQIDKLQVRNLASDESMTIPTLGNSVLKIK